MVLERHQKDLKQKARTFNYVKCRSFPLQDEFFTMSSDSGSAQSLYYLVISNYVGLCRFLFIGNCGQGCRLGSREMQTGSGYRCRVWSLGLDRMGRCAQVGL